RTKTQSHKDVGLAAKPLSISAIAARASDQLKRGCAADTPSSWLCVFVRTILSLFLAALADLPDETRPPRLRHSRPRRPFPSAGRARATDPRVDRRRRPGGGLAR